MICTGSFFEPAISSETVLEKPMSKSPLMTAGVIAAPPAANCGFSVIFCSLKKNYYTPRNTRATKDIWISPIFSVTGLPASPPPPPPLLSSPPQPVARTPIATTRAALRSHRFIAPPLMFVMRTTMRLPDRTIREPRRPRAGGRVGRDD
jgi:hypothetical protein